MIFIFNVEVFNVEVFNVEVFNVEVFNVEEFGEVLAILNIHHRSMDEAI